MKRFKNYRLVFDGCGLLGLLLLSLYFWYGHPIAKWRVPQPDANTFALGFSPDNQKVYSIKNLTGTGNAAPKPILQRSGMDTGKLEAEYPLQLPADDVSKMKSDGAGRVSFDHRVHLVKDNILFVETSLGIRFYDVQSGECLSQRNMPGGWINYLLKNSTDLHHWGIDGFRNESGKAVLYDLTTGEALHTFERDSAQGLSHSRVSSDQRHLLLVWEKRREGYAKPKYELEILELGTWKSVLRQATDNPAGYAGDGQLQQPDLFIQTSHYKETSHSLNRVECFRIDLAKGSLEPDKSQPFHGFVSKDSIYVRNDIVIEYGIRGEHQPLIPRWKTLWNTMENLVRFGKFPEPAGQQDYRVYDFVTGRPLRQLTGLTAFGHQALKLSHDARFLLGVEYVGDWNNANGPRQQFLSLFEIRSYWWERSWSVVPYLALVLIFLWPVRFLGRKRA